MAKQSPVGALLEGIGGPGGGLLSGLGGLLEAKANNSSQPNAPTGPNAAKPNTLKHGGIVKKTGLALVHKGEKVIPNPNMSLHRALSHLNKGGLHRALNVPEGEKIPADKLAAARNSKSEHVRHMANFAHTLEGFKK